MLDLFSLLRAALKQGCASLTGEAVQLEDFRPAAGKYGAKSAFALRLHLDARALAALLHARRAAFRLWEMPLVEAVSENGGHILFVFTDCFYDAALTALAHALPISGALPVCSGAATALFRQSAPRQSMARTQSVAARICYVQRRMWMLGRNAAGNTYCAQHEAARHAFLLTAGLYDGMCKNRKKALLDCMDALLYMTRCVKPDQRRAALRDCAHIAKTAAKALYDLFYQQKGRIWI